MSFRSSRFQKPPSHAPKGDETPQTKFDRDLDLYSNRVPACAGWIHACNVLVILVSVVGAPFTAFASLLFLFAVPFNAALASIATSCAQQRDLSRFQLILLAEREGK